MSERSAYLVTTGCRINKFISHNDVVKLDCTEHQTPFTATRKWNEVMTKVKDATAVLFLIELSGIIELNAVSTKVKADTVKLYTFMKLLIRYLPEHVPKIVFCVRHYFDNLTVFLTRFQLPKNKIS